MCCRTGSTSCLDRGGDAAGRQRRIDPAHHERRTGRKGATAGARGHATGGQTGVVRRRGIRASRGDSRVVCGRRRGRRIRAAGGNPGVVGAGRGGGGLAEATAAPAIIPPRRRPLRHPPSTSRRSCSSRNRSSSRSSEDDTGVVGGVGRMVSAVVTAVVGAMVGRRARGARVGRAGAVVVRRAAAVLVRVRRRARPWCASPCPRTRWSRSCPARTYGWRCRRRDWRSSWSPTPGYASPCRRSDRSRSCPARRCGSRCRPTPVVRVVDPDP